MPSLREALETCVYCKEAFIYLHKFDDKVYVETIRPNQIFDLKQKFEEDEDLPVATDDITLDEDQVMTTMEGFQLDEDSEEGNMFDESSIIDDSDDFYDSNEDDEF